ncbi:MAG: amidase, partial [Kribbellaceae bacterium]|nr:amidase [Kribbellaceae bacterium]
MSPGPRPALATVEELQARINEVNPLIDAVCTPNPAALTEAARLDTERDDGRIRSPLHGMAVLVKDNIDTADLPTTAGSLVLADQPPPPHDAPLVRRLREAGCVILGKTNLSEWANFRGSASSSGWSGYGGLTRNPYALNRSAGGSSSGSGSAVAAGLADLAVGTETNGSIVCPAALNGVVGLKPTVGLVPQQGIVPISHSQDTAGPMTRTV